MANRNIRPRPVEKKRPSVRASRLEQLCRDRGIIISAPRRIILQILDQAEDHPHIDEIHRRVQQLDSSINISTTYRTIRMLSDVGVLMKLHLGGNRTRYEEAHPDQHEHLIDVRTGDVIELRGTAIEEALQAALAREGYQLVRYRLELFGDKIDAHTSRAASLSGGQDAQADC